MITHPPGSGLRYPVTLRGEDPVKLMMGLSGAFLAFLLTGLLAQAVLRVSWFLRGQPDFREYQSLALAYELPDGILASHLGIAGLLLFVLLIHRYWHGRKAIWVISVQPGGRWRYLLICFVVAAAVLNVVMWLMRGGNTAWQASQPDWAIYLALILITSPLQAAAEEFFFRGYLQQAIGSLAGRAWVRRRVLIPGIRHLPRRPERCALRAPIGFRSDRRDPGVGHGWSGGRDRRSRGQQRLRFRVRAVHGRCRHTQGDLGDLLGGGLLGPS